MSYKVDTVSDEIKGKFEAMLRQGAQNFEGGIQSIMNEFNNRKDLLVGKEHFGYDIINHRNPDVPDTDSHVAYTIDGAPVEYTDFAYGQLMNRLKMPVHYAQRLNATEWGRDLLVTNLRTLTDKNINGEKLLLRQVDGKIKGVLSDAYKRIDFAPVAEAMVEQGLKAGLVPMGCVNSDTRYAIKMLHPQMYQPTENEVIVMGLELRTSDYGNGAFLLRLFIARILCKNLMAAEEISKRVHIGSRLEGTDIAYSQRTYELDSKTMQSAVGDVINSGMIEDKSSAVAGFIAKANEKTLTDTEAKAVFTQLRKKGTINKEQVDTASALYNNVQEVTLLPQSKTLWRLGNVLSLMAQNTDLAGDKALDLESEAGRVMGVA